jgi:malate dehydrogenase (oxaloacetate-decarboxylating)
MDYGEKSVEAHLKQNVIKITPNVDVETKEDLSIYYTPGVAAVSRAIASDKKKVFDLTIKRNSVAVISDGSAVLGLGNIGPEGALPVMEGKALLFSKLAGIDAFPICLATQDTQEIIQTIRNIAPVFGGINLEDISAPRCFEVEKAIEDMGIPVMHDDQHGTGIVVLAGLINALKVVNKKIENCKIVISGAGAAGTAITKFLLAYSEKKLNIIVVDSKGSVCQPRENLTPEKKELADLTEHYDCCSLTDAIKGADIFIGVSAPNILTQEMVKSMAKDSIVFAMANPDPEIDPKLAIEAGVRVIATGRSDYPNQINNVLAFPGVFRGAFDAKATKITQSMKLAAAYAIANCVETPTEVNIIPRALDPKVVQTVAKAVKEAAIKENVIRN